MRSIRQLSGILATALIAAAPMGGIANAEPKDVGPTATEYPLPSYYRDKSAAPYPAGLPLSLCVSQAKGTTGADMCAFPLPGQEPNYNPANPVVFSNDPNTGAFTGNFPSESFYVLAESITNFPGSGGKEAELLVLGGIEAAYLSQMKPGLEDVFTRVRIRLRNAPAQAVYTVQHPWGSTTIDCTGPLDPKGVPDCSAGGMKWFDPQGQLLEQGADTIDIALQVTNPLAANSDPKTMPAFLRWPDLNDARLKIGAEQFIGDPNILSTVVAPAPLLRNTVIVNGAGNNITNDQWAVTGKLYTFPAKLLFTPPASTDFGAVYLGESSAVKTFTIANDADAPADLLTVNSIGRTVSTVDFNIQPSATAPCDLAQAFTLGPKQSCNFDVVFAPAATAAFGAKTGTILVETSASAQPVETVVTGVAADKTLALTLPAPAAQMMVLAGQPEQLVTFEALYGGPEAVTPGYEFQFSMKDAAGAWVPVQAYGTSPIFNWNIAGQAPGTYQVKVDMRVAGTTTPVQIPNVPEVIASFTIQQFNLAFTQPAPGAPGGPAGAVASFATNTLPGLEYSYQIYMSGVWSTVTPYSTSSTWSWNTSTYPPGPYPVRALARPVGTQEVMTSATYNYLITGKVAAAKTVTVAVTPKTAKTRPAMVNFVAAASGGSGNYEYKFTLVNTKAKTSQVVQDWSPATNWTWFPDVATAAGKYQVKVEARVWGSTDPKLVRLKTIAYTLK